MLLLCRRLGSDLSQLSIDMSEGFEVSDRILVTDQSGKNLMLMFRSMTAELHLPSLNLYLLKQHFQFPRKLSKLHPPCRFSL